MSKEARETVTQFINWLEDRHGIGLAPSVDKLELFLDGFLRDCAEKLPGRKGMSPEKIRAAAEKYRIQLEDLGFLGVRQPHDLKNPSKEQALNQATYCCSQIPVFLVQGRNAKAERWLSWVQGVMWSFGVSSIEEAKDDNRPEGSLYDKDA